MISKIINATTTKPPMTSPKINPKVELLEPLVIDDPPLPPID